MGDDGVWRVRCTVFLDLGDEAASPLPRGLGPKEYLVLAANYVEAIEKVKARLKLGNCTIGQLQGVELLGELLT